jgi:hypothetical protein
VEDEEEELGEKRKKRKPIARAPARIRVMGLVRRSDRETAMMGSKTGRDSCPGFLRRM